MRILSVENLNKVRKAVPSIERKSGVKIGFLKDGKVSVKGKEVDEFVVEKIISAIDFGFDKEDALLLLNGDFVLEFIDVKEHTRRKNLKDVRARIIGKKGKAKNTIQELTGGVVAVNENTVGLIVDSTHLNSAVQAIILIIQGAKHGNAFAYLERQNNYLKNVDEEDLGLKDPKKDKL